MLLGSRALARFAALWRGASVPCGALHRTLARTKGALAHAGGLCRWRRLCGFCLVHADRAMIGGHLFEAHIHERSCQPGRRDNEEHRDHFARDAMSRRGVLQRERRGVKLIVRNRVITKDVRGGVVKFSLKPSNLRQAHSHRSSLLVLVLAPRTVPLW